MQHSKLKDIIISLSAIILLVIAFSYVVGNMGESPKTATYGEIMQEFDNLNVAEYSLDLGSGKLQYKLKGAAENEAATVYSVPNVNLFLNDIEDYRQNYNEANPDKPLVQNYFPINDNFFISTILPYLIMTVLMIVFAVFIMRQAGGGGRMTQFSKANVKNQAKSNNTTFADVAGADEEKEELKEIVDFLKNPKKYQELGARVPKGVLLVGPPGTGKTLLAKAVAGEAGVPFFSISGSDFVEMFVGVGASRVRDLFDQAKKHLPAIIFIDEIDAVGRHRGAGLGGGHDEREQTLNQLLVEMDGFNDNEGIIIIAATNRRDILDPALLRPGRFDRQIVVNYPDVKGREEILKVHTKNKSLAPDVSLKDVAKVTAGFTGADLANVVNEAALLAARNNRRAITKYDIEESTIKVVAGPEKKSRIITPKERNLTAYHEAGHAVCTYYLPTQDKVHQVTIIPRGMAGGFTMSLPENDRSYRTKMQMKEEIIVLLAGRVAEKLILDDISTGASNDIERATGIARNMVTRYGFSEKLGPVLYGSENDEVFLGRGYAQGKNYSESVASEIDSEIRELIETGYESAKDILTKNMDQLHLLAKYLLKYDKIDGKDFASLMQGTLNFNDDQELASEAEKLAENAEKNDGE